MKQARVTFFSIYRCAQFSLFDGYHFKIHRLCTSIRSRAANARSETTFILLIAGAAGVANAIAMQNYLCEAMSLLLTEPDDIK